MNQPNVIVYVPFMHPALAPADLPPGVLRFDPNIGPGAGPSATEGACRPESLPLSEDQARTTLAGMLAYAKGFNDPQDLRNLARWGEESSLSPSHSGLRSEFADLSRFMEQGGGLPGPPGEPGEQGGAEAGPDLAQAQATLLLAWALEERLQELVRLESSLGERWSRVGQALGLEEEDAEELGGGLAGLDFSEGEATMAEAYMGPGSPFLAWPVVVENMVLFLPEGSAEEGEAGLFTAQAPLAETWAEQGIALEEASEEDLQALGWADWAHGREGRLMAGRAPAWSVLGLGRLPEAKPWLAKEVVLLYWNRSA